MVVPTSLSPSFLSAPCVVTWPPLRRTLLSGPASMMMLSPATVTFTGTTRPLAYLIFQPSGVPVAVRTYWVTVGSVPPCGGPRTFHVPAASASAIGAGATVPAEVDGVLVAAGTTAVDVVSAGFSDLA